MEDNGMKTEYTPVSVELVELTANDVITDSTPYIWDDDDYDEDRKSVV